MRQGGGPPGKRRALWGIFDQRHAYLHVAPDRHEDHAKELLADTTAIVTSDRWWAYTHLPLTRRQLCWAHLRRDFAAHAEGLAAEKEFGEHGLQALRAECSGHGRSSRHTCDRRELERTIRQLEGEFKPIINRYASRRARNKRCRGMARNLLKAWPALWTFATHAACSQPTTTPSAACRSAVIYRKLSLGSQSKDGEQRIAQAALRAHHLPPTTPLTVRLPHRRDHRPYPRRPRAPAQLNRPTERLPKKNLAEGADEAADFGSVRLTVDLAWWVVS